MVILGNTESPIINHAVIIGKSMIVRKHISSVELFLALLKRDMEKEKIHCNKKVKYENTPASGEQ